MKQDFDWVLNRAYIRDGNNFHTGEALLIACLLHSKGRGRESKDMVDVKRIMKDHNLDITKERD
jgi:hypothetical protein